MAPEADTATTVPGQVTPRGAFLRALAVPGWGHAAIGAGSRGAFYVGAEGGTAWMFLRTRSRLRDARRIRDLREANVRRRLADEGVTDPVMIDAALEVDEGVADARGLVESRKQQSEDWTAIGIFLVFLSGADAYVSAHLQDFPGPIQLQVQSRADGGVDVGARVPVGR